MKYALLIFLMFVSGCGPKGFIKGNYDDVNAENLLNDSWSETDMQVAVQSLAKSLTESDYVKLHFGPAVTIAGKIANKTSEHIDTQSVMDMTRVELTKNSQVVFVDVEAREDIKTELAYQASNVEKSTRAVAGEQVGASYLLSGTLSSVVQEVGKDKSVYYKLTLSFTDIRTGVVIWSDHKQIRKVYKKRRI
ncbi:penicillin-binding protein activator LpoB [Bdellovibrio bacteriovorus]|uniref:penicillin-binding protein activator LpoB n=1 Tax=Bdellovibrio bacteriovorus TaxID=959 RepID=UPI003AA8FB87